MENCLVTYIYPKAECYFEDFIAGIHAQTNKDFSIIIFNDSVEDAIVKFNTLLHPFEIINLNGKTINEIRHGSVRYLIDRNDIKTIIFQDIDDIPSKSRMAVSLELLSRYDMICNDLSAFNEQGFIKENIWSERLNDLFEFDCKFIQSWNIVGLGNTAIRKALLHKSPHFSDQVIAYDWYLFYQIMKKSGCKAIFTNSCQTYYRQHDGNIVGITNPINDQYLEYVHRVKYIHYQELIKHKFNELKGELTKLESQKNSKRYLDNKILNKPLFWWEEPEYYV